MTKSGVNRLVWMLLLTIFTGCGFDGPVMSVTELKSVLADPNREVTVIDVRPTAQFKKGHVPGAKNYPLEEIDLTWNSISSIKGEIAIICTCGKRSLAAIKKLSVKGINTALVEGGMKKWEAAGYPIEKVN